MSKKKGDKKQPKDNQPSYILKRKKKKKRNKYVDAFVNFFTFDRHGVMRRHLLSFGVSICAIIIGGMLGIHGTKMFDENQAKTLTSYNTQVQFSQTNNTNLTLHKIQLSSNRKTAYVPFTFSDMSQISVDANNYSVMVGGATKKMAPGTLTGQMVLFGDTSRGAILLHSLHKIPNQPIVVVLRSNLKLSPSSKQDTNVSTSGTHNTIQNYESKYNALDFEINPGAEKTKVNHNLKTSDSLSNIYNILFGKHDLKQNYKNDKQARSAIKIDDNQAKEYTQRLKRLGFKLPKFKGKKGWGKNHDQPAWMNPKWRPYDSIQNNGVPRNKKNKVNAKKIEQDPSAAPSQQSTDDVDNIQFPQILKKPDGTTTDDAPNTQGSSGDNDSSNDSSSDSSSSSSSGSGSSGEKPSEIWNDLQQAWDDVLSRKHTIYSINAQAIFETKALIHDINSQTSVGAKKHFKQVN